MMMLMINMMKRRRTSRTWGDLKMDFFNFIYLKYPFLYRFLIWSEEIQRWPFEYILRYFSFIGCLLLHVVLFGSSFQCLRLLLFFDAQLPNPSLRTVSPTYSPRADQGLWSPAYAIHEPRLVLLITGPTTLPMLFAWPEFIITFWILYFNSSQVLGLRAYRDHTARLRLARAQRQLACYPAWDLNSVSLSRYDYYHYGILIFDKINRFFFCFAGKFTKKGFSKRTLATQRVIAGRDRIKRQRRDGADECSPPRTLLSSSIISRFFTRLLLLFDCFAFLPTL